MKSTLGAAVVPAEVSASNERDENGGLLHARQVYAHFLRLRFAAFLSRGRFFRGLSAPSFS